MGDLWWLRQNGLEAVITRMAGKGIPVIGVCGGFQMWNESFLIRMVWKKRNDARHGVPADPHDLCGEEDEDE